MKMKVFASPRRIKGESSMVMAPKGVNRRMDQNDRAEYLVETYADPILRLSYAYLKTRPTPRISARRCS